jgi:hypothetical protein
MKSVGSKRNCSSKMYLAELQNFEADIKSGWETISENIEIQPKRVCFIMN